MPESALVGARRIRKRSQSTQVPCARAGSITVWTFVTRGGKQQSFRIRAKQLAHPGQNQMADHLCPGRAAGLAGHDGTQFHASSRSANFLICVDFPVLRRPQRI